MKKIAAILITLAICAGSLSAWENVITYGLTGSNPTTIELDDSSHDKYKFTSTGFSIGYLGIFDCGLTLKDTFTLGFGKVDGKNFDERYKDATVKPSNISVTDIFGIGYSPIRNDKFLLSIFGTIGFTTDIGFTAIKNKAESKDNDSAKDMVYAEVWAASGFLLGTEVTAVYTPSRIFSIYGSLSLNSAMGLLTHATSINNGKDEDHKSDEHDVLPYVKILPSIGIAWRF